MQKVEELELFKKKVEEKLLFDNSLNLSGKQEVKNFDLNTTKSKTPQSK
jgi:hypothetical protein